MSKRRISETLHIAAGRICCSNCGHDLAPAGSNWKTAAAVSAAPLKSLPGAGLGIETRAIVRRFACPKCATLLDSETALPEDPYLEDIVAA
jgi:acetone carboxylase gamma subunit